MQKRNNYNPTQGIVIKPYGTHPPLSPTWVGQSPQKKSEAKNVDTILDKVKAIHPIYRILTQDFGQT